MSEAKNDEGITIPIQWTVPPGTVSMFANHLLVQMDEHEAYLSFYDVPPPICQMATDLHNVESITANLVARIVVPKERLGRIKQVIDAAVEEFSRRDAKRSSSHDSRPRRKAR